MATATSNTATLQSIFGRSWFWFSQITSIIGVISIIDDLNSWALLASTVMTWLRENIHVVYAALEWLGQAFHLIIEAYRFVVHPLIRFLLGWLPFEVPTIVLDLLLITSLALSGILRERYAATAPFSAAVHQFEDALRARLKRDKAKVDARAFEIVLAELTSSANRTEQLRSVHSEALARARREGRAPEELSGYEVTIELLGDKARSYFHDFGFDAYHSKVDPLEERKKKFETAEDNTVRFWVRLAAFLFALLFLDFVMFVLPQAQAGASLSWLTGSPMRTSSSAAVGWTAQVMSHCALVRPALTAMAAS